MSRFKEILKIGAVSAALGTGVGLWSEIEGNEDARGRVITIDYCKKLHWQGNALVTKAMEDCLEEGVPGGEPLGDKVDTNDPIEYLDSARTHESERSQFNVGRVAVYTVAAPVVVTGWLLVA